MLSLLLTVAVLGCQSSPPPGKLAILRHSLVRDGSGAQVQATVKNTGSAPVEIAELKVKFYDSGGKLLGSSRDAVMNLKGGDTWDFVIKFSGADPTRISNYDIETLAATSSERLSR